MISERINVFCDDEASLNVSDDKRSCQFMCWKLELGINNSLLFVVYHALLKFLRIWGVKIMNNDFNVQALFGSVVRPYRIRRVWSGSFFIDRDTPHTQLLIFLLLFSADAGRPGSRGCCRLSRKLPIPRGAAAELAAELALWKLADTDVPAPGAEPGDRRPRSLAAALAQPSEGVCKDVDGI
jgi:hypothetical protein